MAALIAWLYVLFSPYRIAKRVLDDPDTERFLDGK